MLTSTSVHAASHTVRRLSFISVAELLPLHIPSFMLVNFYEACVTFLEGKQFSFVVGVVANETQHVYDGKEQLLHVSKAQTPLDALRTTVVLIF